MESKAQNSPRRPVKNEESRNMANAPKEEKSELIRIAEENLDYTKRIFIDTQKIRKYMFWRMIINIILITLTVAPIIVALIWLPSFLSGTFGSYFGGGSLDLNSVSDILNDLK